MDCSVCDTPLFFESAVQLIPCLHIICLRCYESICKFAKTCPFPYCFSPLRLNPDMRLNKCSYEKCRRRIAPVGELIELECAHLLCGECHGEVFRGRTTGFCPECDGPVAADGEETCVICTKFGPAEKMAATDCCGATVCMPCAEKLKKNKGEKEVKCPEGKCKKKKNNAKEEKELSTTCSCGMTCLNEPLPNFPSENECDHEVCLQCLEKTIEANEQSKVVPCCPNEMCKQPYRSESVLALRVLFPERKKYFDLFEVGFHIGLDKLKDETVLVVEDPAKFDFANRSFTIKACLTEDEETTVSIDFDKMGNVGDLLREARKALKIPPTEKVYGYNLRIDGEDKAIVLSPEMIHQDLATAGALQATMVMVNMSGIVSANRHVAQPKTKKK